MGQVVFRRPLGEELLIDLSEVVAAKLNRNLKSITLYLKGAGKEGAFTITFPTLEEAENFWNTEIISALVVNFDVESIE